MVPSIYSNSVYLIVNDVSTAVCNSARGMEGRLKQGYWKPWEERMRNDWGGGWTSKCLGWP